MFLLLIYLRNNWRNTRVITDFLIFYVILGKYFVKGIVSKKRVIVYFYYNILHVCFFFGAGAGQSTALIASSKTVLSPFVVNAEHSKYFTAPTSLAIERPCGYVMGCSRLSFNFSIVSLSSLRSSLVPTKMMGTLLQ